MKRTRERGQVLVLFVGGMFGLLAIAALAIDLSSVYSTQQTEKAATDAAALAGAQQLGIVGSQSDAVRQLARDDAWATLLGRFGITGSPTCDTSVDNSDCSLPGTGYHAFISTPAKTTPANQQSLQVTLSYPNFQLSFARLFGQNGWNVAKASVAVNDRKHSYAIVTLRPPSSAVISGVRDIKVGSNVQVVVSTGDVGTNANMTYGGSSAVLSLDPGYKMEYYDPNNPPLWGLNPPGTLMTGLIHDPGYPVPLEAGAPVGSVDSGAGCAAIALQLVQPNSKYAPFVPMAGGSPDTTKITCYKAGVYSTSPPVPNGSLAIFEPGLYFFDGGLDAQGSVIGGYDPGSPGVAFVFPETQNTMFNNLTNGSIPGIVALNAGTRYQNQTPSGIEATAAADYSGGFVQTNTSPKKLMMTVIVPPDSNCPVSFTTFVTCTNNEENKNDSIKLTGSSGVYLAGVQYAPSDNVSVSGNTANGGYVGQVWAWTLTYEGNSQINLEGDQNTGPGTLRLDAACSGPGTPCIP